MNVYSIFIVPYQRVPPADDYILEEIAALFYGAVRRVYQASFAGSEHLLQSGQFRNGSIDTIYRIGLFLS